MLLPSETSVLSESEGESNPTPVAAGVLPRHSDTLVNRPPTSYKVAGLWPPEAEPLTEGFPA